MIFTSKYTKDEVKIAIKELLLKINRKEEVTIEECEELFYETLYHIK